MTLWLCIRNIIVSHLPLTVHYKVGHKIFSQIRYFFWLEGLALGLQEAHLS